MSLSVGIVGLPNAGKSTLFNALVARRLAETAARPFTTIEPHEAVVSVPDKNLDELSRLISPYCLFTDDIFLFLSQVNFKHVSLLQEVYYQSAHNHFRQEIASIING